MKAALASILLAAAAFAPAASATSFTYGGIPIVEGTHVDRRLSAARDACMREASIPLRGTENRKNFYYGVALKSCLYRKGFFGDGGHVYPVPLFGRPAYKR